MHFQFTIFSTLMGLSGGNSTVSQGRSTVEKGDSGVIFIFITFIINAVDT